MIERGHSIDLPTLRNVRLLICLTVMIGIRIIRVRTLMSKYIYISYMLSNYD